MNLQYTPYTIPLVLAGLFGVLQVYLGWQRSDRRAATWYALTFAGISVWSFLQVFMFSSVGLEAKTLWLRLLVPCMAYTGIAWGLFGLIYSGRGEWVTRSVVLGTVALVGLVLATSLTDSIHGLVITPTGLDATGGFALLQYEWGPLFWVYTVITYVVFSAGTGALFLRFLRSRNVYRKLSFSLFLGGVTLGSANVVTYAGLSPVPGVSLLPLLSLFWAIVAVLVLTSVRFVRMVPLETVLSKVSRSDSLTPIARDTVLEEISIGVIILDDTGRVVDINPIGRRIIGGTDERVVGNRLVDLVDQAVFESGDPEFLQDENVMPGEYRGVWAESADGQRRCYDLSITDIVDHDGTVSGRALLVHDVTDREKRKQTLETRTDELERQNEQLEEFASIVSHDLRNPLSVAKGYAELADQRHDWELADDMNRSLDRIDTIIDDVLTMARQGQTIGDTESVDLAALAREAWSQVETAAATLDVPAEMTVEADRDRLARLFENLFRNAVEHGGEDVTVTVGSLTDGFYVADDGPGIPPAERDDIFEEGHTTSENGTGLGLSIAQTAVEAHGWEISIGDSDAGGARFEITGVSSTRTANPREQSV